jgi:predicted nucleic acid-binding protein
MIAYLDSSILLRIVLDQPNALPEWNRIKRGVSSSLILTESLRTVDRLRIRAQFSDEEIASLRQTVLSAVGVMELVEVDASILDRAAQPMPTEIGTLDAIHLATALLRRESTGENIPLATHDRALAVAAQAHGFPVLGLTLSQ